MARCQTCNRKLAKPDRTHCGGTKAKPICDAEDHEIIERCAVCKGLAILGEPCPGGVDEAGNVTGTAAYHRTKSGNPMKGPEERRKVV